MSEDWRDSPHVPRLQVLAHHFGFNSSPFCYRTLSPFSLHDVLPLRIRYHIDWDKQSLPSTAIITPFHPSPLHSPPGFQFDMSDIPTRAGHYFCFFSLRLRLYLVSIKFITVCVHLVMEPQSGRCNIRKIRRV